MVRPAWALRTGLVVSEAGPDPQRPGPGPKETAPHKDLIREGVTRALEAGLSTRALQDDGPTRGSGPEPSLDHRRRPTTSMPTSLPSILT